MRSHASSVVCSMRVRRRARVVHEDVGLPEAADGLTDPRLQVGLAGDVEPDEDALAAVRLDVRLDRAPLRVEDVADATLRLRANSRASCGAHAGARPR